MAARTEAILMEHRHDRDKQLLKVVKLCGGALLLVVLVGLESRRPPMLSGAAALALTLPFGLFMRHKRLREIDDFIALVRRPHKVVWIFSTRTRTRLNGIPTGTYESITICSSERRMITLPNVGGRLAVLWDALREELPHASFGWSREAQHRFARDPESLRGAAA